MPPKRDLSHIQAHAYRATGTAPPPTRDDRLEEAGGIAAQKHAIDLMRKIPHVSPPHRRSIFGFIQGFVDFLQKYMPEELPKSAMPDRYPRLMGIYLMVRIRWSKDTVRPVVLEDGSIEKRYMATSTIHTYRNYAQSAARVLLYPATEADVRRANQEIGQIVYELVVCFKLAREPVPKYLMGVDEVEILIDHLFKNEHVTASDLQMGCLLLTIMYTAARIGTLVSTPGYEDKVLRWRDIQFRPLTDLQNSCIGVSMDLTLSHWKGHQWTRKKRLVYTIDGVTLSRNIIFDLPLLLYAHAWKSGVIEDSAGKSLADAFTSHTNTLFTVKSDCQSQPVFVRHKVGNRADLDYSGPLRAGTVFGRFRSLMTQTGLIGKDGQIPTLYCLRRGRLNSWYYDPQVGPELARLLAGHEPDSTTLEHYYIVTQVDGRSVTLLDHLGAVANRPTLTPADDRLQKTFARKPTRELADEDPMYAFYRKGITILALSISLANDAWKQLSPFVEEPEVYGAFSAEDAVALLSEFKLLADRHLLALRKQEVSSASSVRQSMSSNPKDIAALGFARLAALRAEVSESEDEAELDKADGSGEDICLKTSEVSLGTPEVEDATSADDLRITSTELLSKKVEYVLHKCSSGDGTRLCAQCLCDPTSRLDYRKKMWHPYRLAHHIAGYHTPEQELKRDLVRRGMDYKLPGKVVCKFPPTKPDSGREFCGESWGDVSFWQHLQFHEAHLPAKHFEWVKAYVAFKLDTRNESRGKQAERPWQKNIATSPLVYLRYPYDLPPKADTSRVPEFPLAVRNLMDPAYPMPDLRVNGKIVLPTPQNAPDETMRILATKLAELYVRVPGALYKPDKITLDVDFSRYERYMRAAKEHNEVYEAAAEPIFAEGSRT